MPDPDIAEFTTDTWPTRLAAALAAFAAFAEQRRALCPDVIPSAAVTIRGDRVAVRVTKRRDLDTGHGRLAQKSTDLQAEDLVSTVARIIAEPLPGCHPWSAGEIRLTHARGPEARIKGKLLPRWQSKGQIEFSRTFGSLDLDDLQRLLALLATIAPHNDELPLWDVGIGCMRFESKGGYDVIDTLGVRAPSPALAIRLGLVSIAAAYRLGGFTPPAARPDHILLNGRAFDTATAYVDARAIDDAATALLTPVFEHPRLDPNVLTRGDMTRHLGIRSGAR